MAETQRPRLHFTAPTGWLNDPYGICWAAGRYHLFYQHNPAGTAWKWDLSWGHATSVDLMDWRHQPVALSPRKHEGCWSGTTLVDDDRPVAFYTSVTADNWGKARVVTALPDADLTKWLAHGTAIDGPPSHFEVTAFRDPFIFRADEGWTMIVGGGLSDGTALILQYTSLDRRSWVHDGVVCSRPTSETDGTWTGAIWECPQLFPIGDDWILVVSVGADPAVPFVAAAIGRYDGRTFSPDQWQRLTHDQVTYATTSFTDRDGRRCLLSWLREDEKHDPNSRDWSGALSLPAVADLGPDRKVRLTPHPAVTSRREMPPVVVGLLTSEPDVHPVPGLPLDLDLNTGHTGGFSLSVENQGGELVTIESTRPVDLTVRPHGHTATRIPRSSPSVRIIVDVGLINIFAGEGCATVRFACIGNLRLCISGATDGTIAGYTLRSS